MSLRLVAVQTPGKPHHLTNARVILERPCHIGPGQPGIAVLVEQALLRGQQRAFAVDIQCAAFEEQRAGEPRYSKML